MDENQHLEPTCAANALQKLSSLAIDLGVDDLAEQHDHYLYGTGRKPMEHKITLSEQTYEALQRQAKQSQRSPDALAEDWLKQRLDLERYPELEWREGPGGWRVGIRGTAIDAYTVIGYSQIGYSPQEIAGELLPRLTVEQVHAALCYYADHPAEIDRFLTEAQTEASKARLYRRLGPKGYRQVTGLSEIPQVIRESGIEYSEGSGTSEPDQAAPR